MLMLIVVPAPKGDEKTTIGDVARKMAEEIKLKPEGVRRGPQEQGELGGLRFARLPWGGTHAEAGLPIRGVHYAARDGSRFVVLWTQDVMPEGKEALRLTEAAILSFRKST